MMQKATQTLQVVTGRGKSLINNRHRTRFSIIREGLSFSTFKPSTVPPNFKPSSSTNTPSSSSKSNGVLSSPSPNWGVFRENETEDIQVLVNTFTAPALAHGLRDRETTLQQAAKLAEEGLYEELQKVLAPFLKSAVEKRRAPRVDLDLSNGFSNQDVLLIQRCLQRMPRQVFQAATGNKRASVVIPLCNVDGVASVLFERRSSTVRTHKQQVCFPGGMVDEGLDNTIIQTSLREMEEELGIPAAKTEVLGILRCKWHEVSSLTGIAVTPVVGFIGELNELKPFLKPNLDEVEQLFTVPMKDIMNQRNWIVRNFSAPVFNGGPFPIWGLTAYLLEKFLKDVVRKVGINE